MAVLTAGLRTVQKPQGGGEFGRGAGLVEEGEPAVDVSGAQEHGVRFSRGDDGRAIHALAGIGELIESGHFTLPIVQTFPLAEIAERMQLVGPHVS